MITEAVDPAQVSCSIIYAANNICIDNASLSFQITDLEANVRRMLPPASPGSEGSNSSSCIIVESASETDSQCGRGRELFPVGRDAAAGSMGCKKWSIGLQLHDISTVPVIDDETSESEGSPAEGGSGLEYYQDMASLPILCRPAAGISTRQARSTVYFACLAQGHTYYCVLSRFTECLLSGQHAP